MNKRYAKIRKAFVEKWGIREKEGDPLLDVFDLLLQLHEKVDMLSELKIEKEDLRSAISSGAESAIKDKIEIVPVEIDYHRLAEAFFSQGWKEGEGEVERLESGREIAAGPVGQKSFGISRWRRMIGHILQDQKEKEGE